jgi:hypothetical protein
MLIDTTFYTFNVFNARISRHNFLIYVLNTVHRMHYLAFSYIYILISHLIISNFRSLISFFAPGQLIGGFRTPLHTTIFFQLIGSFELQLYFIFFFTDNFGD